MENELPLPLPVPVVRGCGMSMGYGGGYSLVSPEERKRIDRLWKEIFEPHVCCDHVSAIKKDIERVFGVSEKEFKMMVDWYKKLDEFKSPPPSEPVR